MKSLITKQYFSGIVIFNVSFIVFIVIFWIYHSPLKVLKRRVLVYLHSKCVCSVVIDLLVIPNKMHQPVLK